MSTPRPLHPRPHVPRGLRLVLAAIVLMLILPALDRLVVERWWFQSLGYDRVFFTRIVARLILLAAGGLAAFAIVYTNVRIALRGVVARPRIVEAVSPIPIALTALMRRAALPFALAV